MAAAALAPVRFSRRAHTLALRPHGRMGSTVFLAALSIVCGQPSRPYCQQPVWILLRGPQTAPWPCHFCRCCRARLVARPEPREEPRQKPRQKPRPEPRRSEPGSQEKWRKEARVGPARSDREASVILLLPVDTPAAERRCRPLHPTGCEAGAPSRAFCAPHRWWLWRARCPARQARCRAPRQACRASEVCRRPQASGGERGASPAETASRAKRDRESPRSEPENQNPRSPARRCLYPCLCKRV